MKYFVQFSYLSSTSNRIKVIFENNYSRFTLFLGSIVEPTQFRLKKVISALSIVANEGPHWRK